MPMFTLQSKSHLLLSFRNLLSRFSLIGMKEILQGMDTVILTQKVDMVSFTKCCDYNNRECFLNQDGISQWNSKYKLILSRN